MENQKTQLSMSLGLYEYLLLISPNELVRRFAWKIKQFFTQQYDCTKANRLSPHITVGTFLLREKLESTIVRSLEHFAITVEPFKAEFDGFGSFSSQTIFLNISNNQPFAQLSKGSKHASARFTSNNSHFSSNAHLTIARAMDAEQFRDAWQDWKDKSFKASFNVSEMILLRRPFEKDKVSRFEKIATFPFGGTDPSGGQLQLQF